MSDNEITVPVTVTSKRDVTRSEVNSKKSVVFVNKTGHAHMMPENMAQDRQKQGKGHIIEKSHKEYMRLFKAAHGYDEKIGTKKILQKNGKIMAVTDTSSIDMDALLQKESMESERARKEYGGR